ncbi:DUF6602 domain-containing protein [Pseudomonas psychrophila]|uniref:DUF6602 domain-containing protein n=1 Tax=Pseudomonas psychrophila TaxID=122355 RepID=UPI0037F4AF0E
MYALSELLKKIRDREKVVLDEHQIKHAPTIGKMYEGLTKELLNQSKLDEYGVKVVSGFMQVGEEQSVQIDCMIVIGEGVPVPKTDEFTYPTHQVLAVIEVKKNLMATEMADAYDHLNDTLRLSKLDYQRQEDENTLEFSTARPAAEYMCLFGEPAPRYEESRSLPFHKRAVYHTLVRERLTPVRIAIGYNGFKSEQNFRNSINRFYDNKVNKQGYGVINMPNLMISDGFSVIKTNGLPYQGFWSELDGWGWLASSSSNPFLLILELLYDRIELALGVTVDRGPDLQEEVLHPLMLAKPVQTEQGMGWSYMVLTAKVPKDEPQSREWTPLEISSFQKDLLALVHEHGELSNDDPTLTNFKKQHTIEDIHGLVQPLLEARFLLSSNGTLSVGPTDLAVAKVGEQWYCGNDAGGRFKQWITRLSHQ